MREYGMVISVWESVYVYPSAGKRRKQRARKRKGRSQGARPLLSLPKEARNAVLNCHRGVNLRESKLPDTLGVCREQAGMLQGQLKSELSSNRKPPAWKQRRALNPTMPSHEGNKLEIHFLPPGLSPPNQQPLSHCVSRSHVYIIEMDGRQEKGPENLCRRELKVSV